MRAHVNVWCACDDSLGRRYLCCAIPNQITIRRQRLHLLNGHFVMWEIQRARNRTTTADQSWPTLKSSFSLLQRLWSSRIMHFMLFHLVWIQLCSTIRITGCLACTQQQQQQKEWFIVLPWNRIRIEWREYWKKKKNKTKEKNTNCRCYVLVSWATFIQYIVVPCPVHVCYYVQWLFLLSLHCIGAIYLDVTSTLIVCCLEQRALPPFVALGMCTAVTQQHSKLKMAREKKNNNKKLKTVAH